MPAPAAEPARAPAGASTGAFRVDAAAIVYKLFDVGYEIRLDRALDLLAASAPERVRPVRGEAQALQIANPPVTVIVGHERVTVAGVPRAVELSARIFDFGVVSLRARVELPPDLPWGDFAAIGSALDGDAGHDAFDGVFAQHLRLLAERIAPAIVRPAVAPQTEDFIVYRVTRLADETGAPVTPAALRDEDVVPLLLNETRPLSAAARRELLPHRFAYYEDDLALLTWENALVVEPRPHDADVQFILEFANAQLLELRYYDAALDAELPRMYDRIAETRRRGPWLSLRNRYAALLGALQAQVADSTEIVERVDNALKVTDDVYLARVYSAALEIFRARVWRAGIDRKLAIIRETYGMLNDEAQAGRAEALELAIVLLIVLEIVMALVRG